MCKVRKIINQRIDELCKERDLSLYALSNESGVPLSTLIHIMDGSTKNPGIMTIVKLCEGFEITLAEFFITSEFAEALEVMNEEQ